MSTPAIPIRNIYFLLCYALNHAQEARYVDVRTESCDRVGDLMAQVLVRSLQQLIKRGLHRDYVAARERLSFPKPKILPAEELRRPCFGSLARTCEFGELSIDILPNQIIRAILERLVREDEIAASRRGEIRDLLRIFSPCSDLRLDARIFRRVHLHQNMRHYRFVLDVCEFVYVNLLPTDGAGDARFHDFCRDEARMGQLFECFIRNFFAQEQTRYCVGSSLIDWHADEARSSRGGMEMLPTMRTDISLRSKELSGDNVIVECKFYANPFQTQFARKSYISAHLYQLFAYLKNREREVGWGSARGLLLYACAGEEFDETLHLHGHDIRIRAVRLDRHWTEISADLLGLLARSADDAEIAQTA